MEEGGRSRAPRRTRLRHLLCKGVPEAHSLAQELEPQAEAPTRHRRNRSSTRASVQLCRGPPLPPLAAKAVAANGSPLEDDGAHRSKGWLAEDMRRHLCRTEPESSQDSSVYPLREHVAFCGKCDRPDGVDLASLLRDVAPRFSEDGFRRVKLCWWRTASRSLSIRLCRRP
jgi:hypothetical protein